MTKKELLENEMFKSAPMDAEIEIPNRYYCTGVDEREDKTIEDVHYWEFKKLISFD